ncbi:MAG: hypothetical protein AAGE05_07265 [Pseudomonadota bacterium]
MRFQSPISGAFATLALPAIFLAGCGEIEQSFDDEFNAGFTEEYLATCSTELTNNGIGAAAVDSFCDCSVERLTEALSPSELMSVSDEQVETITAPCIDVLIDKDGTLIGTAE